MQTILHPQPLSLSILELCNNASKGPCFPLFSPAQIGPGPLESRIDLQGFPASFDRQVPLAHLVVSAAHVVVGKIVVRFDLQGLSAGLDRVLVKAGFVINQTDLAP